MRGTKTGAFTAEEKSEADRIFEKVRKEKDISKNYLNAKIQEWNRLQYFKQEIFDAFPDRALRNIRQFCRRRYHNLETGPWTEEQDNTLRRAYAQHPDRWVEISKLVDRSAYDCRDRWRDNLKCKDKLDSGPWSQQEEEALLRIVKELRDKIDHKPTKDPTAPTIPKDEIPVNWSLVSESLGHHRSAKRCREKYAKLRAREERARVKKTRRATKSSSRPKPTKKKKKTSRRARCEEMLKSFELGDYYDVLREIHESFPDHATRFHDEDNVVWAIVSQKHADSKFGGDGAHGMLRRVAFEAAMAWDLPSVRRTLDRAPSIAARALILANAIDGTRNPALMRSYRPGAGAGSKRAKGREEEGREERGGKALSSEMVTDSDGESDSEEFTSALEEYEEGT